MEAQPCAVLLYKTCLYYNKMWRLGGWVFLESTPLQNYIHCWVSPKHAFSKITCSIGVNDGHFYWPMEERLSRVCTEREDEWRTYRILHYSPELIIADTKADGNRGFHNWPFPSITCSLCCPLVLTSCQSSTTRIPCSAFRVR